jgi:hypothetical protein
VSIRIDQPSALPRSSTLRHSATITCCMLSLECLASSPPPPPPPYTISIYILYVYILYICVCVSSYTIYIYCMSIVCIYRYTIYIERESSQASPAAWSRAPCGPGGSRPSRRMPAPRRAAPVVLEPLWWCCYGGVSGGGVRLVITIDVVGENMLVVGEESRQGTTREGGNIEHV